MFWSDIFSPKSPNPILSGLRHAAKPPPTGPKKQVLRQWLRMAFGVPEAICLPGPGHRRRMMVQGFCSGTPQHEQASEVWPRCRFHCGGLDCTLLLPFPGLETRLAAAGTPSFVLCCVVV